MRATDHRDAGAARLPSSGDRRGSASGCSEFYAGRPQGRDIRRGHRARVAQHSGEPEVRVPRRSGIRRRRARRRSTRSAISNWRRGCRSSCGAASPTTSCSTAAVAGRCGSPRCSSGRCAGCWRIRAPTRSSTNFAGQWLQLRNLRSVAPGLRTCSRTSTTTCGRRSGARPSCSSRASIREDRSVLDLLTADYTFVNERLAQALRHSERVRQPVPARHRSPTRRAAACSGRAACCR